MRRGGVTPGERGVTGKVQNVAGPVCGAQSRPGSGKSYNGAEPPERRGKAVGGVAYRDAPTAPARSISATGSCRRGATKGRRAVVIAMLSDDGLPDFAQARPCGLAPWPSGRASFFIGGLRGPAYL